MIRSNVVLPEPDGPSSATSSPDSTLRLTLCNAANAPNFFVMFLTSTLIVKCFLRDAAPRLCFRPTLSTQLSRAQEMSAATPRQMRRWNHSCGSTLQSAAASYLSCPEYVHSRPRQLRT